jgi:D-methionine transport system permease protein
MKTDWNEIVQLLLNATGKTLYMVLLAGMFTLLIGLPVGVVLFISRRGGLLPLPRLNRVLGAVINLGRSLPFVVMLVQGVQSLGDRCVRSLAHRRS